MFYSKTVFHFWEGGKTEFRFVRGKTEFCFRLKSAPTPTPHHRKQLLFGVTRNAVMRKTGEYREVTHLVT